MGGSLFQYWQSKIAVQIFPTSRVIQNYPGCFKTPLDEEIFVQLSWIANIGIRSRETLLSKGKTHSVFLYILRNLPTIRKTLFPLQYSINMTPTVHSRKYSSNGSFLTTARVLHTMDSLMHNFKGGPNLVKDGEPEYDTLKQDSMLHGVDS